MSEHSLYTVTTDSTQYFAKKESGGKGYSLYLMANNGIKVPKFITLSSSFFDEFKKIAGIDDFITKILSDDSISLKEASQKIKKKIVDINMPLAIYEEIVKAHEWLEKDLISVRSSAHDEDSVLHSFAGHLKTFLYISDLDIIVESIKECWASAFSEHSLFYRKTHKLNILDIKVSVILQEMITPDTSGVSFTCNPVDGSGNYIFINSIYGAGTGIVSGHYTPDTYVLAKDDGVIFEKNVTEKTKKFVRDEINQTVVEVEVELTEQNAETLTLSNLKELYNKAIKIEKFFGRAQDIEWAIMDGEVFILQSRPITTQSDNKGGILQLWDNSNIIESYGGITLPLTFSFAHYTYHQVYAQFCEILLVPQKCIKEMDHFLKNMLGHFYGRMYYNLFSWYKLASILPGYRYNRAFMETMMGTRESLQSKIAEKIKPPEYHQGFMAKLRSLFGGMRFFYFHLNIQNIVDDFITNFHITYNKFRSTDYSRMSSDAVYEEYKKLEKEMLWKWHAPIINDVLCMVHFGIFKKLTTKWLSHLGPSFHNDLLSSSSDIESVMPTKRLIYMTNYISKRPVLKDLILKTPNALCLEAINQSPFQEFYHMILEYIDQYGFRCMSEMKLEQKNMHQDPGLFFVFLKNLINSNQTDVHEYDRRERQLRDGALALLEQHLSGAKRIIYNWSLKNTRQAVINRENTRFCNTRIYGVVRSMFFAIGEDFAKSNIIDTPEDIFYLTLEELKGSFEGTNSIQNLRALITLKKEEFETYKDLEPKNRFTTRGPVYWNNTSMLKAKKSAPLEAPIHAHILTGTPCSPGTVEGIVKVIKDNSDDMVLNGEILVAERTDPGWIPLYPSIRGLIVERGGLLSHSAIIAREMGIPTVMGVKGLTNELRSGMKVRLHGESGVIEIMEQ